MQLSRQTPVGNAPPVSPDRLFRGVYFIDPAQMPPPPAGARVLMVVDSGGVVLGASWVLNEQATDIANRAWNWLDERDKPALPPPALQIVK